MDVVDVGGFLLIFVDFGDLCDFVDFCGCWWIFVISVDFGGFGGF